MEKPFSLKNICAQRTCVRPLPTVRAATPEPPTGGQGGTRLRRVNKDRRGGLLNRRRNAPPLSPCGGAPQHQAAKRRSPANGGGQPGSPAYCGGSKGARCPATEAPFASPVEGAGGTPDGGELPHPAAGEAPRPGSPRQTAERQGGRGAALGSGGRLQRAQGGAARRKKRHRFL